MTKYKRNDPCPCGSGKKFKKCCERTLIGKKYRATKIENNSPSSISSFFQKNIAPVKKPSEKEIPSDKKESDKNKDKKEDQSKDK
ncbi:MAG: hypothetical protein K1060chlam5_01151 [Candidatus Anoxychlamydiales bacterium]|nr:hypothetical protein [Candidatus Anoxychlamydiales bacterium]